MKNDDAILLKKYLSRYYRAKQRNAILKNRLAEISEELEHPSMPPCKTDAMKVDTSEGGEGAASLIFKKADVEDRFQKQIESEVQIILDINDVLECLPSDSVERSILELRHLDCKGWGYISRATHLTRSPCYDHYKKGIRMLLQHPFVQKKLEAYKNHTRTE